MVGFARGEASQKKSVLWANFRKKNEIAGQVGCMMSFVAGKCDAIG